MDALLRPVAPGRFPPPNGFADALRRGRRRRVRKLGTGAACTGAALAVLFGMAVPGGSLGAVSGLEPVAPPGVAGSPAARERVTEDGPADAPPAASRERGAVAADRPAAASPGVVPSPRPGGRTDGGVRPADPTPSSPGAPPVSEPVELTYEDQDPAAPCQDVERWCVAADVAGAATQPARDLRLVVCRSVAGTEDGLYFERADPVAFTIAVAGGVVWRWQPEERGRIERYDVPVDRWQCAVWRTPWHRVDGDGRAVRPGTYTFSARSHALNLHDAQAAVDFTVG